MAMSTPGTELSISVADYPLNGLEKFSPSELEAIAASLRVTFPENTRLVYYGPYPPSDRNLPWQKTLDDGITPIGGIKYFTNGGWTYPAGADMSGPPGATGPAGPPGPTGPQGSDAEVTHENILAAGGLVTPESVSLGGNFGADSGLVVGFGPNGQIIGSSDSATLAAVSGIGTTFDGVYGRSQSGYAVRGESVLGVGGYFYSGDGTALEARGGARGFAIYASGLANPAIFADVIPGSLANTIEAVASAGAGGDFTSASGTGMVARSTSGFYIAEFYNLASPTEDQLGIERATLSFRWAMNGFALRLVPPSTPTGNIDWLLPGTGGPLAADGDVVHRTGTESITGPKTINDFKENQINSPTGAAVTLTLTASSYQVLQLATGALTTITMPAVAAGKSFTLMVKQPTSGTPGSATFPVATQWGNAGAPVITATLNKMDVISFISDGVKWYGSYIQGFTHSP